MMVSLTKYRVPGWYHPWWKEHFEPRVRPVPDAEREAHPHAEHFGTPYLACKRCGMDVWYLTKHVRNAHGDDVELLPLTMKVDTSDHHGWRDSSQPEQYQTHPLRCLDLRERK